MWRIKIRNVNVYVNEFPEAVLQAYNCEKIVLHSSIWLRFNGQIQTSTPPILLETVAMADESILYIYNDRQIRKKNGKTLVTYILTTPGRVLFNNLINSVLVWNQKSFIIKP